MRMQKVEDSFSLLLLGPLGDIDEQSVELLSILGILSPTCESFPRPSSGFLPSY